MRDVFKKLIEVFPEFEDEAVRIDENLNSLGEIKNFFDENNEEYKKNLKNVLDSLMNVLNIVEGLDNSEYCIETLRPRIEYMDKKLEEELVSYKKRVRDSCKSLSSSLNEINKGDSYGTIFKYIENQGW